MEVPNHVAIILDGNGRWAKKRGMPRSYGHKVGCENLEKICDIAKEVGIKYLTVYAFSTENWKRPKDEIAVLMRLFRNYLEKCINIATKNQMCVRVIGDISAFDADIQEGIRRLEAHSSQFHELHFQLGLNYGSRDEILRAVRGVLADYQKGDLNPEDLDQLKFSSYLDTRGIPDPDLLIRTSGEQRLSNFLLWQMAYTEFYFTPVAWPDFDKEELLKAIRQYNERDRRYGGL